ncbi:MAG: Ca2+-binding EF-hand superfamily protein, partial [Planctomycetota bacterium]
MGAPSSPSPLIQDGGPPKKKARKNAGKKNAGKKKAGQKKAGQKKAGQKKPAQGEGKGNTKQQPARKEKLSAPVRPPLPNPFIDAKPLTAAQAMARFDINRDKRLDPRELKAARKDEANRKRLMNKLLREFDEDKNGTFDGQEMTRILGQQATLRRQATEAAYDKDGNNRLDENERKAMLRDLDDKREARTARAANKGKGGAKPKPKPSSKADTEAAAAEAESALRKQLMKRFDEDGDGQLSPEEFREMSLYIQEERIAAARTDKPQAEPKAKPQEAAAKKTRPEPKPKPKPKLSKEERRAQLLETYDLDKDGKLSDEERAASKAKPAPEAPASKPNAEPKPKLSNEERRAQLLETYDLDKDGKLSDEERAASKAKPAPEAPASKPNAK